MEQDLPLLNRNSDDESDRISIELEKIAEQRPTLWTTVLRYLILLISWVHSALPRFLQIGGLRPKKDRQHSTAWLDSLRGYAACIVVKFHLYGFSNRPFFGQPFIHAFEAGRGSVEIFFVISGYVLSVRMLKMIRNQQAPQLLGSLASATFRRWLRLYLPTAFATLVVALSVQMNLCRRDLWQPTLFGQLSVWLQDAMWSSDPFHDITGWWIDNGFKTQYLFQMWTIPLEFRGSMALFLFVLGSCKLSTRGRMILCWVVIVFCYRWQVLYVACFLAGLFIADLSLSFPPDNPEGWLQLPRFQLEADGTRQKRRTRLISIARKTGSILIFFLGLLFLSVPEDTGINGPFPFQYISKLTPWYYVKFSDEYFWLSIGAILLVLSLEYSAILQAPLRWNFSLYLGEISFGIYAMHPLMNWTLYEPYVKRWQEVQLGFSIWADSFILLVMLLISITAGDYFIRVDTKIVGFGRWLQARLFTKWEK